ncbi:MAG: nucleotidyl transferase AbiEii/AbiGii toxin family protein [Firmicutes bacterium]|nr:nucleotidyl transferase AbiEii/AbiGii toxin family protein [Bacillota bacterium]
MPMYNKAQLAAEAHELHVVRDTLEKAYRLRDVLRFLDSSELLRNSLALKGGTAINMLFFNLPRLSVDIDLDFCENISRDDILQKRNVIENLIVGTPLPLGMGSANCLQNIEL